MGHYDCKSCDATPYEEHSPDCERFGTKPPPTEGTDMNQIEKVARAIWDQQRNHWGHYRDMVPDLCEWEELTQSKQRELMREAKAAIAAMPVPAEPVAWMYERGHARHLHKTRLRDGGLHYYGDGWAETPLYALPTPPAGGSDAE